MGTCCHLGGGNDVVWQKLVGKKICWNTGVLGGCGVLVEGSGRVIPPMPVPAPCNGLVTVGAGTSFVEGLVIVTEAIVSAVIRSGGSCGTDCCGLCPPTQVCQSRTQSEGFHRGPWGAPHLRSVVGLQQTRVV